MPVPQGKTEGKVLNLMGATVDLSGPLNLKGRPSISRCPSHLCKMILVVHGEPAKCIGL